jgi:hypothetical protein
MPSRSIIAFAIFLALAGVAHAAPYYTYQPTLLPQVTNNSDLGTSTKYWRYLYTNNVCLAGDCRSAWPGASAATYLSSSSPWTVGGLTYVVSNSAISSVATTTLTGNSQIALSQPIVVVGPSASVLSIVADSIGDTQLAFNTGQNLTTASSPTFAGLTIGSLNGVLKGSSGVVSAASNGTDYTLITANACSAGQHVSQITAAGVITCSADTGGAPDPYSIATTSTIAIPQLAYFTKTAGLTTLGGVATSSLSVGTGLTNSGTLGYQVGGTDASISFASIAANSLWANRTGSAAVPTVIATSSLGIAISDTTGTLTVSRGGTGQASFTSSQLLYGNSTNALLSVATTTFTPSAEFTVGGTIGAFVGGANSTLTIATGGVALTKLATQAANTVLVNQTGGSASPTALATSTFANGLYSGTAGQVLARLSNGTWAGVATTTFSTGLTYSGGSVTVNTSQNIATLSNLTTNGVVITSGGTGALSVDASGLDIANGGTATTTWMNGAVVFYDSGLGTLSQGATQAALFFDKTNSRLGIGSSTPLSAFSIGAGNASSSALVAEYAYGKSGNNATSTAATLSPRTSNRILWPLGTAATTLTLCNFQPGDQLVVTVRNPNATGGAITWAACAGSQLYWPAKTVPTQTTTANGWDIWSFSASTATGSTSPGIIMISGAQTAGF